MGICKSDTRDHSKITTVEIMAPNPNPILFSSASQINGSNSDLSKLPIENSDFLLRTNIDLNDVNQLQKMSIKKPRDTYMHLTLPTGNPQVFMNHSFSIEENKQQDDKKLPTFSDNIPLKNSLIHRRVSLLAVTNPLSQTNLNNNIMMQDRGLTSEKLLKNENDNETLLEESAKKGSNMMQRQMTSKFLMESTMSLKKSHDFLHDNISRFVINNNNMYESKMFQNLAEEMDQMNEDILYVITVISNPCQNQIKVKYYTEFTQRLEVFPKIRLITVELTYLGLPFILTQPHFEPYNIQMRIQSPLNLKYNLMNYVISILPNEAEYIAWIDYNIEFLNENWVDELVDCLKSHNYIKLYKDCLFVNKDANIIGSTSSLIKNKKNTKGYSEYEKILNLDKISGTGWAARKDFITSIGGFLDLCITNENDEIISGCLEGRIEEIIPMNIGQEMKEILKEWQKSIVMNNKNEDLKVLNNVVKKYIIEVEIESPSKNNQIKSTNKNKNEITLNKYKKSDGWNLLIDNHFNPLRDLVRDEKNIYNLRKEREKMYSNFKEYYMHSNDIIF